MEESFAVTLLFSKAKAQKALTDWLNALKAAAERSSQDQRTSTRAQTF